MMTITQQTLLIYILTLLQQRIDEVAYAFKLAAVT